MNFLLENFMEELLNDNVQYRVELWVNGASIKGTLIDGKTYFSLTEEKLKLHGSENATTFSHSYAEGTHPLMHNLSGFVYLTHVNDDVNASVMIKRDRIDAFSILKKRSI